MEREPEFLARGTVVDGRYVVGPAIGAGTFAEVYRAADRHADGRLVALKALRPEAAVRPRMVRRFMREARIGEALQHRNTVRHLRVGVVEARAGRAPLPYIVLELVRGLPLGHLLGRRTRLLPIEAAHVLASVCDALQEAHLEGIVHRDLKPNNILVVSPREHRRTPGDGPTFEDRLGIPPVEDDRWDHVHDRPIKVCDFGLGKLLEVRDRRVSRLTQAGMAAGTVYYMSPEQVLCRRDIDHRADIYGVAMLLHRLLTGRPPFQGDSVVDIANQHVKAPLEPMPTPWCFQPIHEVYLRGGAKKPQERYATAAEMAWDLRAAVDPARYPHDKPTFPRPPVAKRGGLFGWLRGR